MRVLAGTSGYSYAPWKGRFYPEKMPGAQMLRFYAQRFPAVEINNTFYRMPRAELLGRWAEETPEGFTFALKAPQRITHRKRLGEVGREVELLLAAARALGPRLGPILYQLPPYLRKDVPRLRSFLEALPPEPPAAFEFRHPSWLDDEVRQVLREGGAALCQADTDEEPLQAILPTAGWGYLRLRRARYDGEELSRWAERVRAQPWERAFVFFKHEEEARGPELAAAFLARAAAP